MSGDADAKDEGADTAVPEVAPISPVSPSPRGVSSPRNHGIPVLQHSPYGSGGGRRDRSASFQGIVASNAAGTPIVSSRLLGHASPNVGSRYSSHSAGGSPVPNFTGSFSNLPPAAPFLPNLVASSAIPPIANSHLHDVHAKAVRYKVKRMPKFTKRAVSTVSCVAWKGSNKKRDASFSNSNEKKKWYVQTIAFILTNTLQKKLNEVRREKALLEQQIEREQLSHSELVSRLQNMSTGNSAATSVNVADAAADGAAVIRE
eukprot:scaffold6788_cov55-Attheya_sp.AAC.5